MITLQRRSVSVVSHVLDSVTLLVHSQHSRFHSTLNIVCHGKVDVLSVTLRQGSISPEHLHTLHSTPKQANDEVCFCRIPLLWTKTLLYEQAFSVIQMRYKTTIGRDGSIVLGCHSIQRRQCCSAQHDIIVQMVDVVRGQFKGEKRKKKGESQLVIHT